MSEEYQDRRRRDRYQTIGAVRFSHNRDLVISVLHERVVIGQRIEFEDDIGGTQHAFLKNMPSLDRQNVYDLIALLTTAVNEIEVKLKRQGTQQREGE